MLTCPRCGSQNRDSARFCQECGASFSPDRLLPDLDQYLLLAKLCIRPLEWNKGRR